jgi:hypothetical protein
VVDLHEAAARGGCRLADADGRLGALGGGDDAVDPLGVARDPAPDHAAVAADLVGLGGDVQDPLRTAVRRPGRDRCEVLGGDALEQALDAVADVDAWMARAGDDRGERSGGYGVVDVTGRLQALGGLLVAFEVAEVLGEDGFHATVVGRTRCVFSPHPPITRGCLGAVGRVRV